MIYVISINDVPSSYFESEDEAVDYCENLLKTIEYKYYDYCTFSERDDTEIRVYGYYKNLLIHYDRLLLKINLHPIEKR